MIDLTESEQLSFLSAAEGAKYASATLLRIHSLVMDKHADYLAEKLMALGLIESIQRSHIVEYYSLTTAGQDFIKLLRL